MWAGTRRLILPGAPSPVKSIADGLSTPAKLALSHNPHGGVAAMFADCVSCAADYLMTEAGGPAWDREGFERLSAAVRSGLRETAADVVAHVESALRLAHSIGARLQGGSGGMGPSPGGAGGMGPPGKKTGGDWGGRPPEAAEAAGPARLPGPISRGSVTATRCRRVPHLT